MPYPGWVFQNGSVMKPEHGMMTTPDAVAGSNRDSVPDVTRPVTQIPQAGDTELRTVSEADDGERPLSSPDSASVQLFDDCLQDVVLATRNRRNAVNMV